MSETDTVLFSLTQDTHNSEHIDLGAIGGNHTNDRLWKVIRSMKDKGYEITKHDILKLGRMKFKVKEYKTHTEFFSSEDEPEGPHEEFNEAREVQGSGPEDVGVACRICWSEEETDDNP